MDRYRRVEKPREAPPIGEHEVRVTGHGRVRNYINYALFLFQEKGSDEIKIKATGRAINKTVMIAEMIKRRVGGLHQNTSIESIDITDTWEPLEEGLLPLETARHVSVMTISLSKLELDTSSPGYQAPLQAEPVVHISTEEEGGPVDPNAQEVDPAAQEGGEEPSDGNGVGQRSRRGKGRSINRRSKVDGEQQLDAPPQGGGHRGGRRRWRTRGGSAQAQGPVLSEQEEHA